MPWTRRVGTTLLVTVALVAAAGLAVGAQERERFDVDVFARIGAPGHPEGIAVDTDGTIYVGTHTGLVSGDPGPSKVFAFTPDGELLREYTIEGQDLDDTHGILAMAFDADGVLYIADRNPGRIVTLDPATGEQDTYATFADVPPCDGEPDGACSATQADLEDFADYPVFAPDGTMYVTDLEQALIWRVPPGGGEAEVWFTDPALEGVFGPNGIQFLDDGDTLLFAQTGSMPPGTTDAATGRLYTLPIEDDGSPGEMEPFWEGGPVDGPDGFAIAESGNVYVALAGANQLLALSPEGEELARVPGTPVENQLQEVPFDLPASVAFDGERVLVTNQSFFTSNPDNWAVLDVFVGETGRALFRPDLDASTRPGAGPPTDPPRGRPAQAEGAALPATGAGAGLAALAVAALGVTRRRGRGGPGPGAGGAGRRS